MKHALTLILLISISSINSAAALTTQQASNWLDAMDAMNKWGETHKDELAAMRKTHANDLKETTGIPSFTESIDAARAMGFYDEASDLVKKHDFTSFEDWAQTGDKVMKAFMSASFHGKSLDKRLIDELATIKNDKSMPPEQKEMLMKSMQQMQQMMMESSTVSTDDIKAIMPLMSRFRGLSAQ